MAEFEHHHKITPENIIHEANGSFTVKLEPWCERPIVGIPTIGLAQLIYDCASTAMKSYGDLVAESDG